MSSLALLRVPDGLSMQAVVLCTSTTKPAQFEVGALISEADTGFVRTNNGTYEAPIWSDPINSGSLDASSAVKGQSRLTVDPEFPTIPIAVGANDPDYEDAVAHSQETGNAHGATAADIGAVATADHTKAAHDALLINADTVDGSHASDFTPVTHVNSTNGHPVATTTDAGFMSATDKNKVHDRAHNLSSDTDHPDVDPTNKSDGRVLVWRDADGAHVYEEPASVSVDPASETVQGKVELADATETQTGTDNTRAVHPAGLKAVLDAFLPTGMIFPYGGFTAPTGFLMLDGSTPSRATEADLFAALTKTTTGTTVNGSASVTLTSSTGMKAGMPVEGPGIAVGTTVLSVNSGTQITLSANAGAGAGAGTIRVLPFGQGDGSTTFKVPDARGRTLVGVGAGSALTERILGALFGVETHALTESEMPAHTHSYSRAGNEQNDIAPGGSRSLSGTASGTTGSKGSGTAHPNMQPSLAVNYIIKT